MLKGSFAAKAAAAGCVLLSLAGGSFAAEEKYYDISLDLAAAGISRLPENDRLILGTAVFHEMDYCLTGNIRDFKMYYRNKISRTTILSSRDILNRKF